MSAQRALRLSRTCAGAGLLTLLADRDLIFNGLDIVTVVLAIASVALVIASKNKEEQ